jgi:hypothetical protein
MTGEADEGRGRSEGSGPTAGPHGRLAVGPRSWPASSERSRQLPARVLVGLAVLAGGLILGVVAALAAGALAGRAAPAFASPPTSAPSSCSGMSGADAVTLGNEATVGVPDLLGVDSNGILALDPSSGSGYSGWQQCDTSAVKSIALSVASGSSVNYLDLDERGTQTGTLNGGSVTWDPALTSSDCPSVTGSVSGSGGAGHLGVYDAPGGTIAVGSASLELSATCTIALPGGVTDLHLHGNGADTLSSDGAGTSATPSSLPVTFGLALPGSGATETVVVGDPATTTLDFSAVSPSGCSGCYLLVNSSTATQSTLPSSDPSPVTVPADEATLYVGTSADDETWDFSTSGSSGSAPPDVTSYLFSSASTGPPVYFWAGDGTYSIPTLPAGSEFGAQGSTGTTLGSAAVPTSAPSTSLYCGTGTDTYYLSGGSDTFYPASGPDTFYDTSPGNTVSFAGVTASSSAPLEINSSGAEESVDGTQLPNGEAAIGSNAAAYQFLDGPAKTTDRDFTTFVGSADGQSELLAGDAGGLSFYGSGTTNSVVFDTSAGVVANLSGQTQTGSAVLSAGASPTSYSVGSAVPPYGGGASLNQAGTGQVFLSSSGSTDYLANVWNLTGPSAGYSVFYTGPGSTAFSVTGLGTATTGGHNTFYASTAPVSFTSGGEANDFVAGQGVETFAETTTTQTPQNTIDFSGVLANQPTGSRLVVNVSGVNTTVPNYGAGVLVGGTLSTTEVYSFGGAGGSQFNILVGAAAGDTTFDGGSGDYDYRGGGTQSSSSNGNILDFSAVPLTTASSLTLDATSDQASVGGVPESWSQIFDLVGLNGGATTFKAGASGGYSFNGEGAGNTADFSSAAAVNLTLAPVVHDGVTIGADQAAIGTATSGSSCTASPLPGFCDSLADISAIAVGSPGQAGSFYLFAGGSNETFSDLGTGDTDTLDFTSVSTSASSPLTVDVSGGPNSGTARVGSVTYTFTAGTAAFTQFVGPATGNTIYLASPDPGYSYQASQAGDSIDFSSAPAGVTVYYPAAAGSTCSPSTGGTTSGVVCVGSGLDVISGITTVTGSAQGGNEFYAGSPSGSTTVYSFTGNGDANTFTGGNGGTDVFSSNGTGNDFVAGQSNETFNDPVGGNQVDLSHLGAGSTAVVNVTGGNPVGTVINDTAVVNGSYTYNFTSFGANVTSFLGAPGGTAFYAGSAPDTFEGAGTAGDSLSFAFASGNSLTFTVGSPLVCGSGATLGTAQLGSVTESFCGIPNLDGLPGGSTTFVAAINATPVGGYHFNGAGPGNSVSFAASSEAIVANLVAGTVSFDAGTQTDYLVDVPTVTGAAAAGNQFRAANQQDETFLVPAGSTQNAIDFSTVQTSATSPLVVDASGGPSSGTAKVGGYTYSFTSTTYAFSQFTGSTNGNTDFRASPGSGGQSYTYTAAPGTSGNLVDFSAVEVALNVTFTSAGAAQASWAGGTSLVAANLENLTTLIGSSVGGDTYVSGPAGATYSFTTTGSGNTFHLGTGSAAITDNASGNTIDFSQVGTSSLLVNVSGQTTSIPNNEAQAGAATYTFSNEPTVFDAALDAPTVFEVGGLADAFNGANPIGSADGTTLDFTHASGGSTLTITTPGNPGVACTNSATSGAGTIALGPIQECFSGVTVFDSLAAGSTTFATSGNVTGYVFNGQGNLDTADFASSAEGVTVNLAVDPVPFDTTPNVTFLGVAGNDTVAGVTTVIGSGAGGVANYFKAGDSSEVFEDPGQGHQDTLDFSALQTSPGSPLVVNASASRAGPGGSVPSDTASADGNLYSFVAGASNFTVFLGAGTGSTDFIAPRNTGGYSFEGSGPNNTDDFSANTAGVVANLSGATLSAPVGLLGPGEVEVALTGQTTDSVGGVATLIGSPSAANVFYGGLTGVQFEAQSALNTISYLGSSVPVYVDAPASTVYQLDPATDGPDAAVFDTYVLSGSLVIQGSPFTDVFRVGAASTQLEGGGGTDILDLGALDGATVDLGAGTVSGSTTGGTAIAGVTWATSCPTSNPTCPASGLLVLQGILGSQGVDTYRLGPAALDPGAAALSITGSSRAGTTLDLSEITDQAATVHMPVGAAAGTVVGDQAGGPTVSFTGVSGLIGTAVGADHVYAGTGSEILTESGSSGVLDLSGLPAAGSAGATIDVSDQAGVFVGTVTTPAQIGLTLADITGFSTFIGTPGSDSFNQTGPSPVGGYVFVGQGGSNSVDISSGQAGTVLTLSAPNPTHSLAGVADDCTTGLPNNDGVVTANGVAADQFSCVGNITSVGSTFDVEPGDAASLNGGGSGTLQLVGASPGPGAVINLLTGQVSGAAGYAFAFSGMSSIYGTPNDDTFLDGPGSYSLHGGGGTDTISFATAPAAALVNLSASPYLIPSGYAGAGTDLAGDSATGGYGGSLSLQGISSVIGTANFDDLLVGPSSGAGSMIGGSGAERFVLTGGFEYITAGTGNSILDLSQLTGSTTLDLAAGGPQYLGGPASGGVWIVAGNIAEVIASSGQSTLLGGSGPLTLQGGAGTDTLVAGSGPQTLVAGSGSDTLVGGMGVDTMTGGPEPVVFEPGAGTDTLTSPTVGNTLDYSSAPDPVQVNLTANSVSVPPGEPFGGTAVPGESATGGYGATVALAGAGITVVDGTGGNDLFVVGTGDTVNGGSGNDLFVVDGGDNTLTAGAGTSSVFLFLAGGPANVINGGGRATVDFSQGTAPVTVNLQSGYASGGFSGAGTNDRLTGVLNIVGTPYNDLLIAGAPGGVIDGDGAANCASASCGDFLQAGPAGGDTLEAGPTPAASGNDTFCADTQCAVAGTSTGGGNNMIGGSGNDTFFADFGPGDAIDGEGGYNYALVGPQDTYTNIQQLLPP